MYKDKNLTGHFCMFAACAAWGLMSPLSKDAMTHGISGIDRVSFRAVGAALCFWLTSICSKQKEHVPPHYLLLFFFAGMLAIVFNQCCFTIGLSITSPVNASIVTTTLPIVTMILAALFLKEPVTGKKITGIICGAIGALLLILGSGHAAGKGGGRLTGDVLCVAAQCSFAVYLTVFKKLIRKYSVVTCMKWMFTYAAIVILPFTGHDLAHLPWQTVPTSALLETAFVVFVATFMAYLMMMRGQKLLRPTIVSMYNYVQPIVACIVSVATGLGVFGWHQGIAVILVFGGVWLVTQSKSRADVKAEEAHADTSKS
ncbi:MAG: DMT family transporter [Paraprevotella sp.]|nr:DMT family transporter [Paraprevotella sp.]